MLTLLAALVALSPAADFPTGSHAAGAHAPRTAQERRVSCEVVEIRSDHGRRDRHRFRASEILALDFEARLSTRRAGERTLRLRLFTPSGFLYQVLAVPPDPARGHRRLQARLPVAGTSITASGLYGRWTVVPQLDDSNEPCGPGRHFVIRP